MAYSYSVIPLSTKKEKTIDSKNIDKSETFYKLKEDGHNTNILYDSIYENLKHKWT